VGRPEYHDAAKLPSRLVGRPEVLRAHPELAERWAALDAAFPVRITRAFWERARAAGPALMRQALPDPEELTPSAGDLDDPVGDALRSPVPWVVHKHPSRVLLLLTKRCHLTCRYCFRRNHTPGEREDPSPEEWEAAVAYARGCGAREAILSGGDPLAVRDGTLFDAMDALRPALPLVRLHTRAPITAPDRVTPELVSGLRARAPIWVVVHVNHAAELDGAVDQALARLVDAGIPVLNQSVLLRGVNDDADALVALCEALVDRRIKPYYLHHPDAVRGGGHFGVSMERGLALHRELTARVSGVAVPRYVVDPPDGSGKRDVKDGSYQPTHAV
jgi:lysine 2,3-aminomutase